MRRILRQPLWRILLFVEAATYLIFARVGIRLLPFRFVAWFLDREFTFGFNVERNRHETRKRIKWAVEFAARYLPFEVVCFPRGIAAHLMCRMRGIETTLYYGASRSADGGLFAHVWLQDGFDGIVGHNIARNYNVLARFPRALTLD